MEKMLILDMLAVGASENRLNKLSNMNIPTLVIHGTEDPLIPFDHGKKTHSLINNYFMGYEVICLRAGISLISFPR